MVEDREALKMVEYAVERVMARQHPGRPAFYALLAAHREVRRARQALEPAGEGAMAVGRA